MSLHKSKWLFTSRIHFIANSLGVPKSMNWNTSLDNCGEEDGRNKFEKFMHSELQIEEHWRRHFEFMWALVVDIFSKSKETTPQSSMFLDFFYFYSSHSFLFIFPPICRSSSRQSYFKNQSRMVLKRIFYGNIFQDLIVLTEVYLCILAVLESLYYLYE